METGVNPALSRNCDPACFAGKPGQLSKIQKGRASRSRFAKKRSVQKHMRFHWSRRLQSKPVVFICNFTRMKNKFTLGIVMLAAIVAIALLAISHTPSEEAQDTTTNTSTIAVVTTIANGESSTTYDSSVPDGTTALQVLQLVADQHGLDVKTTEYDFGTMVDSIDGVGQDTTDNKYWIYYINEESASKGASDYVVQNNDTILWQYEDSM